MVASRARDFLVEYRKAWNTSKPQKRSRVWVEWKPPPSSFVKVNVDAVINEAKGLVAMGCIFQDDKGQVLTTAGKSVHRRWVVEWAKAWTMMEASQISSGAWAPVCYIRG